MNLGLGGTTFQPRTFLKVALPTVEEDKVQALLKVPSRAEGTQQTLGVGFKSWETTRI